MAESSFDLIVIGSGPGGYVAAIRAAQLGMKTAVVEREELGGICLNWGCIPTKALLRSAEVYGDLRRASAFGLSAENIGFDIAKIVKRSRDAAKRLNGGVGHLLKKNKVAVIKGEGRLDGPGKVTVKDGSGNDSPYEAKHIVIATGARPRVLPGLEPDREKVWTYFEAMVPKTMPASLLVIGSGAIGIEFASFYRGLGAEVTVVELLPQILPAEDDEIAAQARKSLQRRGIKILTSAKVTKLDKSKDAVACTIEAEKGEPQTIEVEQVISAVGVVGNVEGLNLESSRVEVKDGIIVTDGLGQTGEAGVYAIGDVAGGPMLAHKASHEGILCVEAIAGQKVKALDRNLIPGCTYCEPQIASVGLTEAQARESGRAIRVGRFPYTANGKAVALGETAGLIKTIFDAESGQLVGAHMVGADVTELIQGFVVAMNLETTEEDLMRSIFPHPTLSEMMHESVLDAFGRAIHF